MANAHATTFSFPLLTFDEIVACLVELGIDVAVEELKTSKPDPATVNAIYVALIERSTGTTQEELSQPNAHALASLSNYELHEESMPVIMLLRKLSELLETCGVSPMGLLRDISNPRPKGLQRNLSAIINFAKFREERVVVYTDRTERQDDLRDMRDELLNERARLRAELEEAEAKASDVKPEIDALTAECDELQAKVEALNKEQAVLSFDIKEKKAAVKAAHDESVSLNFQILNGKDEVTLLQSQIVSSPDRLRASMRALEQQVETDRSGVEELERQKRGMVARLETIRTAQQDMEDILEHVAETGVEYNKYKAVVREVRSKQNAIDVCESDIAAVGAKKKHVRAMIRKVADKENAFRPDSELKASVSKQALADTRAELEEMRGVLAEARKQREAARDRKAVVAQEMEREKEAHNAEMADMAESFKTLRVSLANYHRRLLGAIGGENEAVPTSTPVSPASATATA